MLSHFSQYYFRIIFQSLAVSFGGVRDIGLGRIGESDIDSWVSGLLYVIGGANKLSSEAEEVLVGVKGLRSRVELRVE